MIAMKITILLEIITFVSDDRRLSIVSPFISIYFFLVFTVTELYFNIILDDICVNALLLYFYCIPCFTEQCLVQDISKLILQLNAILLYK